MSLPITDLPIAARSTRADAVRNRAKVLAGARRAFAEEGLDADMASIAKRAGVGVGTVYRHFETKDALLRALAIDHFEHLAAIVAQVIAERLEPWEALEQTIWRTATYSADDVGMCEVLARQPPDLAATPAAQELRSLTAEVVEAAKLAGAARADASAGDVPMLMCGFGRIAAMDQAGGPVDWRRYLQIMLDGLRAR
jgi:AcrR family transcriptional regulator